MTSHRAGRLNATRLRCNIVSVYTICISHMILNEGFGVQAYKYRYVIYSDNIVKYSDPYMRAQFSPSSPGEGACLLHPPPPRRVAQKG